MWYKGNSATLDYWRPTNETNILGTDSEELYMARTPRNQVVDSIIADLDHAISYLPSGKQLGGTKLSREIALLFKSRVCLVYMFA
jgi:hypothetical protein